MFCIVGTQREEGGHIEPLTGPRLLNLSLSELQIRLLSLFPHFSSLSLSLSLSLFMSLSLYLSLLLYFPRLSLLSLSELQIRLPSLLSPYLSLSSY